MKKSTVMIGLTVLVVALVAASAAWAATQRHNGARAGTAPRGATSFCSALAKDPQAWKDMQALRVQHLADMKAWRAQYGQDPNNAAAQAALATLRTEHWNDMKALMKKYGINVGTGHGWGMMGGSGSGYGYGMMGGGSGSGSGWGMMGGGSGSGSGGMMGGF